LKITLEHYLIETFCRFLGFRFAAFKVVGLEEGQGRISILLDEFAEQLHHLPFWQRVPLKVNEN
jgi:hypothetical protein